MAIRSVQFEQPARADSGEGSVASTSQAGARGSETLEFVRSMLGQLRTMAEAERADMLVYLIEMAYLEASDIMRGERPVRIGRSGFRS